MNAIATSTGHFAPYWSSSESGPDNSLADTIATRFVSYVRDKAEYVAAVWDLAKLFSAQSIERQTLIRKLLTYSFLPANWDGYCGQPILHESIIEAVIFVMKLPASAQLPSPMIGGDGLVGLFWEKGDVYISIDFHGDGSYTFIADTATSQSGEDNRRIDMELPNEITHLLEKLST